MVTPTFYWGFLLLMLASSYSAFRLGRAIGRLQEYNGRTLPMLHLLDWIVSVVDGAPQIAAESLIGRIKADTKRLRSMKYKAL